MRLCDITSAYNESSGGIRTYIEEKRDYLLRETGHEHLLIIPGEKDRVDRRGRLTTVCVESPLLPGQDAYRFFVSFRKVREVLLEHRPDIIELGSYYVEAWAAFACRRRLREDGGNCAIGCYFHTDMAEAYVAAPLRRMARESPKGSGPLWRSLGERLSEVAVAGMERYVKAVFGHCDLALAPSPSQAARLNEHGVQRVQVVPLGVDLDRFHPRQRQTELRARLGAGAGDLILVYAGRMSNEKRVLTLVKALDSLPGDFRAVLCLIGHGPQRGEVEKLARARRSLRILPFQSDRAELARLLASADIYVTAGPHETFGLSVIEAQACGLPVVGVDAGALRDRVLPGLGYLGPVDDAPAMAANIVKAAAERVAIGERARRHVESTFRWDSTFRRLLACYAGIRAP
jgi:alpha-1,6-mannosyltransferase